MRREVSNNIQQQLSLNQNQAQINMNKLQQDINKNIQAVTTQLSNSIQDNNLKMMNLIESQQQLNKSINSNKSSKDNLPDFEYINNYIANEIQAKLPIAIKTSLSDILTTSPELQTLLFNDNNHILDNKINEISEKAKQSILQQIRNEINSKNTLNSNQINELRSLIDKIINKQKEDINSLFSNVDTIKQELLNDLHTKMLEKSLNEKDKYVTQSSLNKILMEQKRSYNIFLFSI